jgi:hypothetical protein
MKHITTLVLVATIFSACQKPDLTPDVTMQGRKTNCVGGGCSDSAAGEMKFQITAQGEVRYNAEHLPPKSPLDENGNQTTGLWGSFWGDLGKFWSPSTAEGNRPTSIPLPKPDEQPSNSGTPAGNGSSGGSETPVVVDIEGDRREPPKNEGKGLRGSELDKAVNNVGRHLTAGWDEISGKGRKKRKEAKEAKRKYNEAMALKDQVEGMATEMDTGSRVIEGVVQDVLDPTKFTPTGDLKNATRELAGEHNNTIDSIVLDTKDIETEVEVPSEKPRYDTPELRSVQHARQYQTYVQEKINGMPEDERAQRQPAVEFANNALTVAESAYRAGDSEKGDFAKEMGLAGLDLALSLTPGVGLLKDAIELGTGYNYVTKSKLTTFERTMAAVGVLTFGYGSKLALAGKAGAILDIIKLGTKEAEVVAEATRAISKAEEIVVAAEKVGVKDRKVIDEIADFVKDGMPCKVASLSPVDRFFGLLVPTAYAADCIPGSTDESLIKVLDSAKNNEISGEKIGEYIARLKDARITKGNFDLPGGTVKEAEFLGDAWVGSNARLVPYEGQPGKFLKISADETKQFRPPVIKVDGRGVANFQWKDPVTGKWLGNGHTTVKD